MVRLALLATFVLSGSAALAKKTAPYIPVGKARVQKTIIAFPKLKLATQDGKLQALSKTVHRTVADNLLFMDLFKLFPEKSYIEDTNKAGIYPTQFKFSDWSSVGVSLLVKALMSYEGNNLKLEAYVYDVKRGRQLLGKRYLTNAESAKRLGHTFANDIVTALTGLPGIFLTKIVTSCDLSGRKELYVMDFDGGNVKQLTKHRSIAFSPAWSPDGTRIAYSLYTRHKKGIKNIDLFEYDFRSKKTRLLSNRKGINSGAVYSPDGRSVAMTMSFKGNPDIFVLNLRNRTVKRLTRSFGFDVDPSFSPDGRRLAFVSSRSGKPMVFTMPSAGGKARRLTYAGRYNATPTWSPQNNKVAFAGWNYGRFDIFIMNPDGTKIERLTKNQGNNEDPHFSPDGNFIVFSSNRTGKRNVYVMNIDGTFVKRLTYGLGNCVAPKWSNAPPQ